ncbi:MAG TPA: ABC transporter permease [Acidimicrobiales bacterium]|nr:ABC transporter permease [Acidimicrobiales bacterium]
MTAVGLDVPAVVAPTAPARLRSFVGRLVRRPAAAVAAAYLVLLVLVAILAPWIAPSGPYEQDLSAINQAPSAAHWLGTDDLGRDVLSRLMHGARISLASSVFAVGAALVVSVPVGLVSGYVGGRLDNVLMRIVDGLQSIPPLVLALAIAGLLGPSLRNIVIALAVIFVPTFVRLIRGQVLAVKEETYIEASRSVGATSSYIVRKRVLHNIASPLIVQASITLGFGLLAEAGLSFLGLGIQPPEPSWGVMLSRAYDYIFEAHWLVFPPGVAILLTVLAFNVLGDGLRDTLRGG